MARGDPDLRVEDDRRVECDDVLPLLDQRPAPLVLHVVVEQDAVMAEVERRSEAPVDVRRREDERSPAAQCSDLLDRGGAFEFLELHRSERTYSLGSPSQ